MMPAFNPYLAGSYPAFMPQMQQPFQQQVPQQAPQMSMPTIHADIIQVGSPDEVDRYPVGAGASQMFMLRDETAIFVKSANANGYSVEIYDRRKPEPPAARFDPQAYVTRDELEARLSALTAKKGKKEAEE